MSTADVRALVAAAFEGSHALLLVIGAGGRVVAANPAMTRITGWTLAELTARPFWETFVAPEDRDNARSDFDRAMTDASHLAIEGDWVDRAGGRRRISMQMDVLLDAHHRPHALSVVGIDVTEQRREHSRLRRRADSDALTGLANRNRVLERLHELLGGRLPRHGYKSSSASEDGIARQSSDHSDHDVTGPTAEAEGAGVLFCDLDGFKAANDQRGHHVGDLVLVEVARRMTAAAGPGVLVGRFGGDEFVLVRPGADHRRLADLATDIERALAQPIALPGLAPDPRHDSSTTPRPASAVHIGVSIGTAVGTPGDAAHDLLRDADRAMYRVKTTRRRYVSRSE